MTRTKAPSEYREYTPDDFGGAGVVSQFVVPAGIGDISWAYSKIKHIKPLLNREVILYVPDEEPKRSSHFINLLPMVHWGGYVKDAGSWASLWQSIPADWPDYYEWSPLIQDFRLNLAPNLHVESGRPLKDWLPRLPMDDSSYHYPLMFSPEDIQQAEDLVQSVSRPIIFIYTSNRDKDRLKAGGWALWSDQDWLSLVQHIVALPECRDASFVLAGAEWDRDRTTDMTKLLQDMFCPRAVISLIAQPLGMVLRVLQRSNYSFCYPSGIGILSNVLNTPGVMLLPWMHRGLEKSYADPYDMAHSRYIAWAAGEHDVAPKWTEVFEWFRGRSLPQLLAATRGKWRN